MIENTYKLDTVNTSNVKKSRWNKDDAEVNKITLKIKKLYLLNFSNRFELHLVVEAIGKVH